jgi:ubiquinone/menaquinone biosynthesis C-methylase UbiE
MIREQVFDTHVADYEQWYQEHKGVYESELAALREQFQKLPEDLRGIEVGVGTGRFAEPLGIKEGVEPSEAMAKKALDRGIEVIEAVAEQLPYGDLHFDFVLFVTICHLKDVRRSLAEAYRVLKPGGTVIIGFLDKEQLVAKSYMEKRHRSTFYSKARFYSVEELQKYLKDAGFRNFDFNQTLFGTLDSIQEVQIAKPGHGEGSFVVVKATKK